MLVNYVEKYHIFIVVKFYYERSKYSKFVSKLSDFVSINK